MEAGSIRLKKDSVKTYIKIQFAGPRQYFWFRFKIFKKNLRHKVHYWSKIDQKYIIFCTHFSSQNAGNRILGHWNFGILLGRTPPDPSIRRGVSLFSIQSVTFFKPTGYFNFYWNPWAGGQSLRNLYWFEWNIKIMAQNILKGVNSTANTKEVRMDKLEEDWNGFLKTC